MPSYENRKLLYPSGLSCYSGETPYFGKKKRIFLLSKLVLFLGSQTQRSGADFDSSIVNCGDIPSLLVNHLTVAGNFEI